MNIHRTLRATVIRLFGTVGAARANNDDDLRAELESHLEMHIEENIRRGMSPDDARRDALLAAGGMTIAAESVRERHRLPWIEHLFADIRHALRALRSKPAYTIAVILTLALGIGANSAMFSLVNAIVLKPLPYPESDRIVSFSILSRGQDMEVVDDRDYFAWRDAAKTVTLAIGEGDNGVIVTSNGPQSMRGMVITENYLSVFGIRPAFGRSFTADEYEQTDAPVVMLGEAFWRSDFNADSAILGRTIAIDGKPKTVVGIMPASFATTRPVMFWQPYRPERPTDPNITHYLFVVGRLNPGASIESARAELTGISNRLHVAGALVEREVKPVLMTLHERRYGSRRGPLLLLFAAVGVLLLIACANLTNLAMARAAGRQREIAVRLALGAGRWRVIQGLLCETIVLSLVGAALGLALAFTSLRYIIHLSPESVGNIDRVHLDVSVLGFTVAIALGTGFVMGLIPAIAAVRGDIHRALSNGSPRSAGSRTQQFARRVLVVAQLATALVLLTGAGLVTRTFWRVASIDPGFQPDGLLDVSLHLPSPRYSDQTADRLFTELLARVRKLPDVQSAALTDAPPLMGGMTFSTRDTSNRPSPMTTVVDVGPDYFRTIGATVRAGRAIDSTDRAGMPKVLVVNTALAKRLFNGNAIGRMLPIGRDTGRIVGVIKDLPQHEFEGTLSGAAYWPMAQQENGTYVHLVTRISGPIGPLESAITHELQSMDRTLPPPKYSRMSDVLAERIAPRKFTFVLLGIFAALAASLAVIGLYGVLAHLVATRTREIGIRVALGADPISVTALILRQGVLLAVLGAVIGIAGSSLAVKALRALVYDMSIYDPWTFTASAALLLIVSILASYFPALRASRVDPVIALRAE